jgi:hypothetical protein
MEELSKKSEKNEKEADEGTNERATIASSRKEENKSVSV